ncbi:DNA gyrase/topoisomerase IV subunit A [Rarobacter incanus]|uniref:DNA topoisomerase (ATP-hydrolyzing) n=1 Tax=Rarobacter incanus TaxID=153494 RepID=A0A542SMI7_9MICO|nr:DNA topoisomerase IV subunit A [Rarobacter incanus]TQK75839.1 DNA gyrase subunit A [Rarobacter incanus]
MAAKSTTGSAQDHGDGTIIEIDVAREMEGSFLEYAYSVIYARALPDARDGLKPVQRRIVFQMMAMGLRPDRPYVKSARVVGDVMGRLHPHGDSAIYDALVRLAQPFSLRLPLVDGHGNFGSLDDGPAASRYTEARMAAAAMAMVADLDEDVVDFVPNYDNKLTQPSVLPSAIPNLLVNGASGIAVGMATNMAPHNLTEVIAAARFLLDNPDADLEALMRFVPGPDLPTGGKIVGLEGIRDAYRTGRGSFRTRATTSIENVTARRKGIIVTELPYLVGPEKVIDKIKEGVQNKKLQGISAVTDLTDRNHGLRLVIEVKTGFNPEAVLEHLFRYTPMEDSFAINNVCLVEGQPRTLGLKELLRVWIDHRVTVVRRRSEFRLTKKRERLHLVEGLLLAILDIDEVIQVIRASDDSEKAKARLQTVFDLSALQADYILELRLRRLTKFSRIELESERDSLRDEIAELEKILGSQARLREVVGDEMDAAAAQYGTPRRTILLDAAGGATPGGNAGSAGKRGAAPLEVPDSPCQVVLSATGFVARTADAEPVSRAGGRLHHDGLRATLSTTARSDIGVVTSAGRVVRLSALELPVLPPTLDAPSIAGGIPLSSLVDLIGDEAPVTLISLADEGAVLALGTRQGVVKRVAPGPAPSRDDWEVISLRDGDRVIGAVETSEAAELVFVSSDSSLLHFPAAAVNPQGRAAAGMAGIRLAAGEHAVFFGAVGRDAAIDGAVVVTVAGAREGLPGIDGGSVKVTPFEAYPGKGRATGGVRSQRFLRGEDSLTAAWVGPAAPRASRADGAPVDLPAPDPRRDGSGQATKYPVATIGE